MSHENHYHRNSVDSGKHSLLKCSNSGTNILNRVNEYCNQQVLENRKVEASCFLWLTEHWDAENNWKKTTHWQTWGNFRELSRYHINNGDIILKQHLESSGANATYLQMLVANATNIWKALLQMLVANATNIWKALLQMLVANATNATNIWKQHLESSGANATYLSEATKKGFVKCYAIQIIKEILLRVHSVKLV